MTSGLRKAHKFIWLLIIIGIPTLILFSIKDLELFSSKNISLSEIEATKSNVIKVAENDLVKASLIKKDSSITIEVILKSTLKNPSSLVYELNKNDGKGKIIGQVTTVGIYSFKTQDSLNGIVIYDALKEKLISKLEF